MSENIIQIPENPTTANDSTTAIITKDQSVCAMNGISFCETPKIPLDATGSEVFNSFLKYHSEMYEAMHSDAFMGMPDYPFNDFYNKFIDLLKDNQDQILTLYGEKFSEEVGVVDIPISKIVNFVMDGSHLISDKTNIYKDGPPNVIATAKPENSTKEEQIKSIIKSIIEPLSEINENVGGIHSLIFFGSATTDKSMPGDIDLMILTEPGIKKDGLVQNMSEVSKSLDYNIKYLNSIKSGKGKIVFSLAGETVTDNHSLDLNIQTVDQFLEAYNLSPKKAKKAASDNLKHMIELKSDKVDSYTNMELTIAQNMVKNGAQLVWGENIKDLNGNDVFLDKTSEYI